MTKYYRFKIKDFKHGSVLIPIEISRAEYEAIPKEYQLGNQQQLAGYEFGKSSWPKNGRCILDARSEKEFNKDNERLLFNCQDGRTD